MKSIFEVYGTWTPMCPEGWKLTEFREVRVGDSFLDRQITHCIPVDNVYHQQLMTSNPRFILEKLPVPSSPPSHPPPPPTIESVYGTPTPTIPEGYVAAGFREIIGPCVYLGYKLGYVVTQRTSSPGYYRLHLKPAPKTIRVVRVLEYVGPEEWVNNTLRNNAVGSDGPIYWALEEGKDIRELSVFKEEVKQ